MSHPKDEAMVNIIIIIMVNIIIIIIMVKCLA